MFVRESRTRLVYLPFNLLAILAGSAGSLDT